MKTPKIAGMATVVVLVVGIASLWMIGLGTADAATHTVCNTDDAGAGSLRDTIGSAAGGDTIWFDGALAGGVIPLVSGELFIDKDLQIEASGLVGGLTVSGGGLSRVFRINAGRTVAISGLTIRAGRAPGGEDGGGMSNSGRLTISGCLITENEAGTPPEFGDEPGDGGGIWNSDSGILTVIDSIISVNAAGEGGALPSSITEFGSGRGGGIYSEGECRVERSTISSNRAGDNLVLGFGGSGGGICSEGLLTVIDSMIDGNRSGDAGGAFRQISMLGRMGGGGIYNGGQGSLLRSTVSNNHSGHGADTVQDGGPGGVGGGIFNSGVIAITESVISGNTAGNGGSGGSGASGDGGHGGGIFNAGDCTLDRSAVVGNAAGDNSQALGSFGLFVSGNGGGIYSDGPLEMTNTSVLSNATGRTSVDGVPGSGGGIFGKKSVILIHCTVALNQANQASAGGGITMHASTPTTVLDLRATVVAENIGMDILSRTGSHMILARGRNFVGRASDVEEVPGNFISGNPMLTMPIDFGGGLLGMLPLPDSPLIDAGGLNFPFAPPTWDQRRERRTDHDIGAIELTADDGEFIEMGIKPLLIAAFASDMRNGIRLTICRHSTRKVGVEYSVDLSSGSWIDLGDVLFGVNSFATFIDQNAERLERSHMASTEGSSDSASLRRGDQDEDWLGGVEVQCEIRVQDF